MLSQLSHTVADANLAGVLSHKRLILTPLLVRVLALTAVMILAHLG